MPMLLLAAVAVFSHGGQTPSVKAALAKDQQLERLLTSRDKKEIQEITIQQGNRCVISLKTVFGVSSPASIHTFLDVFKTLPEDSQAIINATYPGLVDLFGDRRFAIGPTSTLAEAISKTTMDERGWYVQAIKSVKAAPEGMRKGFAVTVKADAFVKTLLLATESETSNKDPGNLLVVNVCKKLTGDPEEVDVRILESKYYTPGAEGRKLPDGAKPRYSSKMKEGVYYIWLNGQPKCPKVLLTANKQWHVVRFSLAEGEEPEVYPQGSEFRIVK